MKHAGLLLAAVAGLSGLMILTVGPFAFAQTPAPPLRLMIPPDALPPPPPPPSPEAPAPLQPVEGRSIKMDGSPPLHAIPLVSPSSEPELGEVPRVPIPRTTAAAGGMEALSLTPEEGPSNQPGGAQMPAPGQSFEGINNINNVIPPDTNGDVGPNHYVQWVNKSFAIWDKGGTLLYGPVAGNTLWAGFGGPCQDKNNGDPIVLYDHLADRWLLSQFALPNYPNGPFYQCVAVSQTPDPTGAYYRYSFLVHDTKMNDYSKLAVWPDGYYMSVNQFSSGKWAGAGAYVFDRANMLAGNAATFQYFDLYSVNSSYGGMLPSDLDGAMSPPSGSPNYFAEVDDAAWIGPNDALRIWEFRVDWTNPANSTFGLAGQPNAVLSTDPFDPNMCNYSRSCIPQPDVSRKVDAISDQLMYRLQYRNFGAHQTLVVNHTVDVDGTDHAGVRWYELRNTGGGWSIYQQGTYAPDSHNRWMGSIAMDVQGNVALGYSVSSSTVYPSIRYTGRLAGDPLGTLPQGEETLIAGSGSQGEGSGSSSSRWGDYSMMAVDPVDNCTFWYTQEYYQTTSGSGWRTRIGSFKFPSCISSPDLSTSAKAVSSGTARPGEVLTYTLALTNTGTMINTVRVTDTLPVGVSYVVGSVLGGATYNAGLGAILWSGEVVPGSPRSLAYRVAVSSPLDNGTMIANTASIDDGVNGVFATAPVSTTVVSSPDLSTSVKAVISGTARPGEVLTYTLALTNTGTMRATARVTDTLPVGVSYVVGSADGGASYNAGLGAILWSGEVMPGSPRSLAYRVAVASPLDSGTVIANTASIDDGVNGVFATAPVTTTVASSPDLRASVKGVNSGTVRPGEVLTYTLALTNTGTMKATVRVTDTLPVGVSYVVGSADGATYNAGLGAILWSGEVMPGSPQGLTYRVAVAGPLDSGTVIANTASIDDGVNGAFATAPVSTTLVSSPDLSTSVKGVSSSIARPGEVLTYTLALTNTGTMITTVRVTDTLPVGVSYVVGSADGGASYNAGLGAILWSGEVMPGSPRSLAYRVVVANPLDNGTVIANTASIDDGVNGVFATAPVTTTVVSSPDLRASLKGVSSGTARPGEVLTYTLTLTNTGTMITTVRVTDTLPVGVSYAAGSADGGASYNAGLGAILWIGEVMPGSPRALTYRVVVAVPLDNGTVIANTVSIDDGVNGVFATAPVSTTVTTGSRPPASSQRVYLPVILKGTFPFW